MAMCPIWMSWKKNSHAGCIKIRGIYEYLRYREKQIEFQDRLPGAGRLQGAVDWPKNQMPEAEEKARENHRALPAGQNCSGLQSDAAAGRLGVLPDQNR